MDADGLVKDLLGEAHAHGNCEALHDLAGIGTRIVETDDLVSSFVDDCPRIDGVLGAVTLLIRLLQYLLLQRIVPDVVYLHIVPAYALDGRLFAQPAH